MTIDPNEGVRLHKLFVKIENGVPVQFDGAPLTWRTDTGERPTDEWLRAQEPAYYGWVQTERPTYDDTTHKAVGRTLWECEIDHTNGTVIQTYDVVELTEDERTEREAEKRKTVTEVRDARITQGFLFNGIRFDSRPEDKLRLAGAAQLAFMYLIDGGDPTAVDWTDPGSGQPFGWIATDNTIVTMTAPEVIEFAKAAARWERLNVFASRNLKDNQNGVPRDFEDDRYWPDPTNF